MLKLRQMLRSKDYGTIVVICHNPPDRLMLCLMVGPYGNYANVYLFYCAHYGRAGTAQKLPLDLSVEWPCNVLQWP